MYIDHSCFSYTDTHMFVLHFLSSSSLTFVSRELVIEVKEIKKKPQVISVFFCRIEAREKKSSARLDGIANYSVSSLFFGTFFLARERNRAFVNW